MRTQIFNWLARAAKSPRRFGGEENNRPVLIEILKEIMRLWSVLVSIVAIVLHF